MQIHVCVKHVPDSGALIELSGEKSFAEGNVKFIPNPFDEYGIEEALKLKGDGEVIIVCAGNTGAVSSIRAALAMGADCAIHVVTEGPFTDSALMAEAVAKVIRQDGSPDMVFTGKQSIDSQGGRFPYFLGQRAGDARHQRRQRAEVRDDCVITSRRSRRRRAPAPPRARPCRGLTIPVYPKLPDIMRPRRSGAEIPGCFP